MNLQGFYSLNRRELIRRLIEDGPVSYRTLGFGLYNHATPKWTPKTYHELTPHDYPLVAARQIVNRWADKLWRVIPMSVSGSAFPQSYILRKDRRNPLDDHFVQHEDSLSAILFAYAHAPGCYLKTWDKPTTPLVIKRADGSLFKHVPDRYLVFEHEGKEGRVYVEMERTRKERTRVVDELDWYRVAYETGGILEPDSMVLWITNDEADRDWLMAHTHPKKKYPHQWFATFSQVLTSPLGADFLQVVA